MSTTTTSRHTAERRLNEWRRGDGNWRLMGLLLAVSDAADPATVGSVWPQSRPQHARDYINLGTRHDDTHEHNTVRELYDADAVRNAEAVPRDQYIARALTSDSATELDVLWREELLATVQAGAATRRIAREATTVTPVEAKRGDFPAHGQTPFAANAAESASAPFDEEDYTQVSYKCTKHEQGFAVNDALVDQAEVAVIERQIEGSGMAVENAINRQHLINAVDNANQNHSVSGNEAAAQDIFEAMENVTDNDFDPCDVVVLHSELRTELADDINALVNMTGAETEDAQVSTRPFGLRFFIGSDATYNGLSSEPASVSGSNTWGWESGSEIGAVVYGSPFVHTVVYQDIGVSELQSPVTDIRDVRGGVARASTDSVQVSNDAISTITQ